VGVIKGAVKKERKKKERRKEGNKWMIEQGKMSTREDEIKKKIVVREEREEKAFVRLCGASSVILVASNLTSDLQVFPRSK
jgi:hypothetical protein